MNCLEFEDALAEYLEGAGDSEQAAHAKSCSACSGLIADLTLIAAEAPLLREAGEPSPRVWKAIEAQLRREGLICKAPRPSLRDFFVAWRTAWVAPALAALVIAAGIKLYQPSRAGDNQPIAKIEVPASTAAPASRPVVPSLSASTEDKAILSTVASRPPAQVAEYRTDLDQANAFIRDAQEALKNDPNDVYTQQLLMNAYEQKQMLYHLAVEQSTAEQNGDVQ
jgi:hypothetical protein